MAKFTVTAEFDDGIKVDATIGGPDSTFGGIVDDLTDFVARVVMPLVARHEAPTSQATEPASTEPAEPPAPDANAVGDGGGDEGDLS